MESLSSIPKGITTQDFAPSRPSRLVIDHSRSRFNSSEKGASLMRAKGTNWLILTVAAGMLALSATAQAQITKQKAKITSTERIEFGMHGLIQIVDSFGEVNVEGWDQPDVELTINKT